MNKVNGQTERIWEQTPVNLPISQSCHWNWLKLLVTSIGEGNFDDYNSSCSKANSNFETVCNSLK